jgi:hypothetical protein
MDDSVPRGPDCQPCHVLLTKEQHRRLRLVTTALGTTMTGYLRPLITREIDKQFSRLGLDRIQPANGRSEQGRAGTASTKAATARGIANGPKVRAAK